MFTVYYFCNNNLFCIEKDGCRCRCSCFFLLYLPPSMLMHFVMIDLVVFAVDLMLCFWYQTICMNTCVFSLWFPVSKFSQDVFFILSDSS
jgi:hypothetical protein